MHDLGTDVSNSESNFCINRRLAGGDHSKGLSSIIPHKTKTSQWRQILRCHGIFILWRERNCKEENWEYHAFVNCYQPLYFSSECTQWQTCVLVYNVLNRVFIFWFHKSFEQETRSNLLSGLTSNLWKIKMNYCNMFHIFSPKSLIDWLIDKLHPYLVVHYICMKQ